MKAYRLILDIVKKLNEPSEIHLIYVTDAPMVKPFRIHHDITVGVDVPVTISPIPYEFIDREEFRKVHEVMENALAEAEAYKVPVDFIVKRGSLKRRYLEKLRRAMTC